MGKGEKIKVAFLGNAVIKKVVPDQVYRDRLTALLQSARTKLAAAKTELETLPPDNETRIAQLATHGQLVADVAAEETRGQTDPAKAWKNMEAVVERAKNLKRATPRWVASQKRSIAEVDTRARRLREETAQMRRERRETQNDSAAARLEKQIAALESQIDNTVEGAQADPEGALSILDDLEGSAQLLRGGTQIAVTYTPQGQRKASRRTTDAVLGALSAATPGDDRLGKLLATAGTEPDGNGLTLRDQIKGTLEVFDDRFAQAADASPDAQRDNTAMRVAAMAGAMALRLVKQKDINDPLLKPVVARAIVQEYGEELARALAGKETGEQDAKAAEKQRQEAKRALALAEALLAEDPVTKVFTGKITGPDAVESIRRQAKAAGIPPSRMLELQRQQLEMRVGALTMQEVKAGEQQQQFILHDLYGELSPADMERLVAYRMEKASVELGRQATSPQWKDPADGGGLVYKPTANGTSGILDQLADYVAAWDADLPADSPPDPAQLEQERFKESMNIRRGMSEMREREATGKVEPKVTPKALEDAAKRLLPPIRPDVLSRLKALAAEIAKLSEEERKSSPLKREFDELKRKLESFRNLAQSLSTKLESKTRAEVEASDEFRQFEALRLEFADPSFRQAPGLGQDHGRGGTLDDARADARSAALQAAQRTQARIKELTAALKTMKEDVDKKQTPEYRELAELVAKQEKARDAERSEGRAGAMNERQYAHLKMLDRWDEEEKERFLAENGQTVEQYVISNLARLLKIDPGAAKQALDTAFRNVQSVPLTITFRAESLFSDSTKDEPAHGPAYVSEVVYSRKDMDMAALIGRGENAQGKVAVTGGHKTQQDKDGKETDANWVAGRGKNYMRWRTDKDDREARQDRLPFKDQQIFGAANPNWEKTKGAVYENKDKPDGKIDPIAEVAVGTNYYGNAHFLLKDSVRTRVAYVVRGQNSNGGGKTAFQRKDFLMLFHDMIKGWDTNQRYLKALLSIGADDYVNTSNAWEFHLYGGFDIRSDAREIYLADVVDPEARGRIERFAAKHGIKVVSDKLRGAPVVHSGAVDSVTL